MGERVFSEADVKEAIRIVLQDWHDNEYGGTPTQDAINEYYKKLLDKLNGEKV